ncbi:hypothetical protein HMN09_00471600 [Mycena chlorophos]|uniref:Uncharacterized protein n=1 Tax=Mycena chlorophos TaxID=658473 RepID=A0A8H6WG23_MYCCL|nr:hypothetical protein HMN09_00471600 [Mycena chlorophos]
MAKSTNDNKTSEAPTAAADAVQTLAGLIERSITPPREDVPPKFPECDIVVPLVSPVSAGSGNSTKLKVEYKVHQKFYEWTARPEGQSGSEPLGSIHLAKDNETSNIKLGDKAGRLLILDTLEKSIREGGTTLIIRIGETRVLTLGGAKHIGSTLQSVREVVLFRRNATKSKDGKKLVQTEEPLSDPWRYMCLAPKCGRVFETGTCCSLHKS